MDKWKELEAKLGGMFGNATVQAEGHRVRFIKRLNGEKLVIETYVDGWIKGEWMTLGEDHQPKNPEGRFYRPIRKRAYPLKHYNRLKRVFGKKEADRKTALVPLVVSPHWNSPRSLISHLRKHFPDLEIKADEVTS